MEKFEEFTEKERVLISMSALKTNMENLERNLASGSVRLNDFSRRVDQLGWDYNHIKENLTLYATKSEVDLIVQKLDSYRNEQQKSNDESRESRKTMHDKMDSLTGVINGVLVSQEGLLVKVAAICTVAYILGSGVLAIVIKGVPK